MSAIDRNRIWDARNELEKAYGPLYVILNSIKYGNVEQQYININNNDIIKIDEILSTYPFMFSSEIYEYWQKNILGDISGHGHLYYKIPTEFRDKINKEYDCKRKRYDRLLGK